MAPTEGSTEGAPSNVTENSTPTPPLGEPAPGGDSFGDEDDGSSNQVPDDADGVKCRNCRRTIHLALLLILGALFTYSFVVQFNDGADVALWLVFYVAQAAVAFLGVVILSPCGPNRGRSVLLSAALIMGLWSVVMIILSSIDLAKTEAGGEETGGDNDGATEREEKAYEVAGAALGLASAMYVACLAKAAAPEGNEERSTGKAIRSPPSDEVSPNTSKDESTFEAEVV